MLCFVALADAYGLQGRLDGIYALASKISAPTQEFRRAVVTQRDIEVKQKLMRRQP
jgi:hypothetical protein